MHPLLLRSASELLKISMDHASVRNQLWIPEEICYSRKHHGVLQYLIKWQGCDASKNTWEPVVNLAGHEDSIAAYELDWQKQYVANSAEEALKRAAKKIEAQEKHKAEIAAKEGKDSVDDGDEGGGDATDEDDEEDDTC